jgi:uncharacterized protein YgbK (DUF1537 family)
MITLHVVADDRTGAMEVAGAAADAGLRALVATSPIDAECVVIDIRTRHVAEGVAAARTRAAHAVAERHAHKIDSLLRGNWRAELAARNAPVLMVPANPLVGRRCEGGVVFDGERAIGRVKPFDRVEVCDATTMGDVAVVVDRWLDDPGAVLAGTGAVLAVAAQRLAGERPAPDRPKLVPPLAVVCGSVHAVALAQIDRFRSLGVPVGDGAPTPDVGTVFVIGGETAAHVLGPAPVVAGGTLAPGIAWGRPGGGGPLIVTKPGSFPMPDHVWEWLS